VPVLIILISKT